MWVVPILVALVAPAALASVGTYVLPTLEDRLKAARRPVVDPSLAHYFQPSNSAGQVVQDIFTGFLPQAAFEVRGGNPPLNNGVDALLESIVGRGASGQAALPTSGLRSGVGVPSGFPGIQGYQPSPQFQQHQIPQAPPPRVRQPGEKSTFGIPDIPTGELNLPTFSVPVSGFSTFPDNAPPRPSFKPQNALPLEPTVGTQDSLNNLPSIPDGPPPAGAFGSGGFGSSGFGSNGGGFGSGGAGFGSGTGNPFGDEDSAANIPIETGPPPGGAAGGAPKRLMEDLLKLFNLGDNAPVGAPSGFPPNAASIGAPFRDIAGFGTISTLLDSLTGAAPADGYSGIIPSAIYESLSGAYKQSDSGNGTKNASETLFGNEKSLRSNLGLIQELITQPNSPFCNPKPVPMAQFDVDAFMGTWFQVVYSPPMSSGPCSMITYRKMEEKGNGGAGTLFSTFEYTTDGNSVGTPDISSGFALLRGPGQLIYKTRSSRSDVNVQVIEAGPINSEGQYEWVVLTVNCNYPVHVFARDPVRFAQQYQPHVNALLEQRGLVDGIKRLLNIVADVDHTLCRFPKALFGPTNSAINPFGR